jgi:hypothetical protein
MPDVVVIEGTSGISLEPVRTFQTSDIVDAWLFLLENPSASGVNLEIDGGRMML